MKYLLGIDNGGTFSKAAIFDIDGNQISLSTVKTDTIIPNPGYTERNMFELWQATKNCIKEAIALSKINADDIAGVSFSGHGKGLYLVDENGEPTYNGFLSTDARAWKEVSNWYENKVNKELYPLTCKKSL